MTTSSKAVSSRGELGSAARGGAVTLVGSATSSVLGFAFNVLLARELGTDGAGIVLQAVAIFTIALSLAKLGLDTTAVWLLPRLVREGSEEVRSAITALLVPAVVAAVVVTLAWFGYASLVPPAGHSEPVYRAVTSVAVFMPAASVMTVSLASTRAFGGVLPYNVIGNIVVPALRPLGLLLAVAFGGAATAAAVSWSVPWLVGAVFAALVLFRRASATTRHRSRKWSPSRQMAKQVLGYSMPRTVASGLEQGIIWLDVVIVGALLGSSEAGVYGSAARFVSAGFVVFTALRIVVAPRFSALLTADDTSAVEELYSVTAQWILLFGAPVYIVLGTFAPTILSWLGSGFQRGSTSLLILAVGSCVFLAAGNVQSLLLMSGRSGWAAVNKGLVLAFNVAGNLLLVPRLGISGAALTWAASMILDTVLAMYQVRRATGISLQVGTIGYVLCVVSAAVAVPCLTVSLFAGQGLWQLGLAVLLSAAALLAYCAADRRRLRLGELRHLRGRR